LNAFQTVINIITFLEEASDGVYNASIPHLAKISPIFPRMTRHDIHHTNYKKKPYERQRVVISSSLQDIQAAGAFFASLPNGALEKLIGKVERSKQDEVDEYEEYKE
jgi:hypothetical protein